MPFLEREPTKEDILKCYDVIKNIVVRTPVLTSESINRITGANLFFKCENFQKAGAFKYRGATNALLSLDEIEKKQGVATHSSGNHAAALSFAARLNNTQAFIVMPESAPSIKKKAVSGYGAKIYYCEPTLKAREATLKKVVEKTGAIFVHPYDNYSVITGQATVALELIEEVPNLDFIIPPIGGGGLASGTALSVFYLAPKIKVIASEPLGANDAFKSFKENKLYPSVNPNTIADGLLTSLSNKTFSIVTKYIYDIFTVQESSIITAMRMVWERLKIIIEPSSAVPLAAVLENKDFFKNKNVGLIVSGGNVDLEKLPWINSI